MLAFISFLVEEKNDENILSQISKSEYIKNDERMKKSKMSRCTTLHFSWKWNYGGLKFMFEETFCRLFMRTFFPFLIGYVSYGDRKK